MRNLARRPAVLHIVRLDCLEGGDDLVHAIEREQAFAGWQNRAEPRILSDNRPPRGKIASAALAEPTAAQTYVLIACNAKLALRRHDVRAVGARIDGKFVSVVELPAIVGQQVEFAFGHPLRGYWIAKTWPSDLGVAKSH